MLVQENHTQVTFHSTYHFFMFAGNNHIIIAYSWKSLWNWQVWMKIVPCYYRSCHKITFIFANTTHHTCPCCCVCFYLCLTYFFAIGIIQFILHIIHRERDVLTLYSVSCNNVFMSHTHSKCAQFICTSTTTQRFCWALNPTPQKTWIVLFRYLYNNRR